MASNKLGVGKMPPRPSKVPSKDGDIKEVVSHSNFSMLNGKVDANILKAIKLMGFEKPTEIQAKTLPQLLMGNDVIGAAKTGSGKTLAFLIPVADRLIKLKFTPRHGTGCLILSPTRELALQTFMVLEKLLTCVPLSCVLVVGGERKNAETRKLIEGRSIIVATPGRLLDHLTNTARFNCNNLQCLIVDEADKLLEAGFERHITGIIKLLPRDRQTVLFSATITGQVENLAKLAMKNDPVYISVQDNDKESTVVGLNQGYCLCPSEHRVAWLFNMLKKTRKQKVMVFFSSCKSVDFHYEFFKNHCQAPVISIHGRQNQPKRKKAYQDFVSSNSVALFCTDVAARGLDVPEVDWIIQYDPPSNPKDYIHRVGRTARGVNGKGNAVLLLRPEEKEFLTLLKKEKVVIDKYQCEDASEDVQKMMENLVATNGVFKTLAWKGYLSYLRCYKSHPMKKIFNIKTLDFKAVGKGFGFIDPPHVDIASLSK